MNQYQRWANKPVFNLGFRIFFLSAAIYGLISMVQWLALYAFSWQLFPFVIPQYWHGREMILGYAFAVVAGFLLTAVQNWTGVAMPRGSALFRLWLLWLLARISALLPPPFLYSALFLDMAFAASLLFIVQSACRQSTGQFKRQAGIIAKLALMLLLQALLAYAFWKQYWSWLPSLLHALVFIIIGLVLTIGRRVLPFFTENGLKALGIAFTPRHNEALDAWCLRVFLLFFVFSFGVQSWGMYLMAGSALFTALLNAKRLAGWYHPAIWRLPLLWSLFVAFAGIILGLLLFALMPWVKSIHFSLALHALTLSGMGLMILAMMARVSLGHTGRNIHQPPQALHWALFLMMAAFIFRVIFPIFWSAQSKIWMIHAQVAWILAFFLFISAYAPILLRPRVDGRAG